MGNTLPKQLIGEKMKRMGIYKKIYSVMAILIFVSVTIQWTGVSKMSAMNDPIDFLVNLSTKKDKLRAGEFNVLVVPHAFVSLQRTNEIKSDQVVTFDADGGCRWGITLPGAPHTRRCTICLDHF